MKTHPLGLATFHNFRIIVFVIRQKDSRNDVWMHYLVLADSQQHFVSKFKFIKLFANSRSASQVTVLTCKVSWITPGPREMRLLVRNRTPTRIGPAARGTAALTRPARRLSEAECLNKAHCVRYSEETHRLELMYVVANTYFVKEKYSRIPKCQNSVFNKPIEIMLSFKSKL